MLTATGIHKSFGSVDVLKNVDITLRPGEITCLIGPSGTGKTTLLRALALLDLPDRGRIDLDDVSYEFPLAHGIQIPPPWPRLSVVFQSLFLWPHLTLRENILLPARNMGHGDIEAELERWVAHFSMGHFINKYPNEASIGQRQRVALARALMLKPAYILMDEITSALDVEQVYKILTALEGLKKEKIGLFLITHQIGFAARAADTIVFMDDGKVVEQGSANVLKNPQSKRLQQFLETVRAVA